MRIRILSATDVQTAVDPRAAIDAMRSAFAQLSRGDARVPVRGRLDGRGTTLLMPAYLAASGGLGAKIVSVFPGNAERGLPIVTGAVLLLDPDTGVPRALLDGTRLTALRTAAGSGLATDLLAPA
ncbi:MAG: ornithine cyclodeaminase family protein, partial [Gemmatimonadota bacterium]